MAGKAPCKKRAKKRYKKRKSLSGKQGVQGLDDFSITIKSKDIGGGLLTVQSLMQAYADKKIDRSVYTGLLYGMSIAVGWVRLKTEGDILSRLDALEIAAREAKENERHNKEVETA